RQKRDIERADLAVLAREIVEDAIMRPYLQPLAIGARGRRRLIAELAHDLSYGFHAIGLGKAGHAVREVGRERLSKLDEQRLQCRRAEPGAEHPDEHGGDQRIMFGEGRAPGFGQAIGLPWTFSGLGYPRAFDEAIPLQRDHML